VHRRQTLDTGAERCAGSRGKRGVGGESTTAAIAAVVGERLSYTVGVSHQGRMSQQQQQQAAPARNLQNGQPTAA